MVFWELVVKVSKSDNSSRKRSIHVSKDFKVCLENKFYPFCVPRLENFDCCFVVQFDLESKKYCNLKSNHFLCSSLKIYVKMWCWNIVMEDLPASVWLLDWTFWDRFPSTRYPPENILAHWWCWCWCWCCPNKGYAAGWWWRCWWCHLAFRHRDSLLLHQVEHVEEVLGDKVVLLQEQNGPWENNHDPSRRRKPISSLTVEIAEDINSVEDLVRFPPPVVFRLRIKELW